MHSVLPPQENRPRAGAVALPGAKRPSRRIAADFLPLLAQWRDGLEGAVLREIERRRLFNWLPVPMGLGVILYFLADREPGLAAPLAGLAFFAAAACALRRRRVAMVGCIAAAAVFGGFAAATWRTADIAAPILERMRIGTVTGFVESLEQRENGVRLVLFVTGMPGVEPAARPLRVRVSTPVRSLNPGDHIGANARLLPPPGPARPGGYDFARDAFFRGVGAVGNLPGKISLVPATEPPPPGLAFAVAVDRARNALTERIASIGGGQAGAMAAALVTGKRGLIGEPTNDDLRAAGIYHVVPM